MGIFANFFKNKKQQNRDSSILNNDSLGDIAVKLDKDGVISAPKDNNHNTFGEPLDKLIDGDLPWGWEYAKSDFIKPRDSKLYDLSIKASKAESIDEEISLLKQFVDFYYEYKDECFNMGECYKKYFSDMHMKCFNSQNKKFEFVKPKEERLKYLEENYDKLIQEEKQKKEDEIKKQSLIKNLDNRLKDKIINNPGILQSDLYKEFDTLLRDEISTIVYYWAKSQKVVREKCGRTYKLYYKGEE